MREKIRNRPRRRFSIDPSVLIAVTSTVCFLGMCWVAGLMVADESVSPWIL